MESNIRNDETYVFVPKCFAQAAREFLSNENRFLNHKRFLNGGIDETGDNSLGVPIKPNQLCSVNNQEEICKDTINNISPNDILLCKRLALYLNISPVSVQLKKFNKVDDEMPQNDNKSTNQNRKHSKNVFEKLKEACVEIEKELGLE